MNWREDDHAGMEHFPVGAPTPIHPAKFDRDSDALNALTNRITAVQTRMAAGEELFPEMITYLARDVPWLEIPAQVRNRTVEKAWNPHLGQPPKWNGNPDFAEPHFLATCGPAFPRDLYHLACSDHEEHTRRYRKEMETGVTHGESSARMAQEVEDKWAGSGKRDCGPLGDETIAFELNWSLPDDEMAAQFRGLLKQWRPNAWRDNAKPRAANVQVDKALVNLAALRFANEVKASKDPDKAREMFWKRLSFEKVKECSSASVFSQAKAAAISRLAVWNLRPSQAAGV